MKWLLFLQVALTGQMIHIEVATEAECRAILASMAGGKTMVLTLKDGIRLPVEKAISCQQEEAEEEKAEPEQARKAGV
jgi:hypothetical protein